MVISQGNVDYVTAFKIAMVVPTIIIFVNIGNKNGSVSNVVITVIISKKSKC